VINQLIQSDSTQTMDPPTPSNNNPKNKKNVSTSEGAFDSMIENETTNKQNDEYKRKRRFKKKKKRKEK